MFEVERLVKSDNVLVLMFAKDVYLYHVVHQIRLIMDVHLFESSVYTIDLVLGLQHKQIYINIYIYICILIECMNETNE